MPLISLRLPLLTHTEAQLGSHVGVSSFALSLRAATKESRDDKQGHKLISNLLLWESVCVCVCAPCEKQGASR